MAKMSISADRCLATFGTLAPGQVNRVQLADLEGEWQKGRVKGRLVHAGWGAAHSCPGLILDPAGDVVDVHVLLSPDLPGHWQHLDDFEGPGYRRGVRHVATTDGDVEASIYVIDA